MWKRVILLCSLLLTVSSADAQTGLSIDTLFNGYGRQRGSVLIDLAKDVLDSHTRIERYKCLIINFKSDIALRMEEAVCRDFKNRGHYGNGVIIKEIRENGQLHNASYMLGKDASSSVAEYILYSCHKDKITLVYLNGHFGADRLNYELEKLKDLFIKVNDKKIKLY
jgi:hypothetical protein